MRANIMDLFPTYFLRGKSWSQCDNVTMCFFNAMWQWTWTQHFGATKIWHPSCTKPHVYLSISIVGRLFAWLQLWLMCMWGVTFFFFLLLLPLITYVWVLMVATSGQWADSSIENIAMWSFPHPLPIFFWRILKKKREKKFMDIRFTRIV